MNFEKDLKWRFDTGEVKFYANVEDDEFIKKVMAGEIAFSKGVSLDVELKSQQTITKGDIKTQYSITNVYKVIQPDEQLELDF